jgi:2-C-methyl-D-erythritol 4-phosphate cytidylyltransferase
MNIALITAGGTGKRAQQEIPKQFLHIEDKPLIIYTLEVFEQHPNIDAIIVACLDGWHEILWAYVRQYNISKLKWIITGGETGYDSIHNGLIELKKHCSNDDIILIHDGNRPMVSNDIISDGLSVYSKYGSAVAVIPCTEVVFKSLDGDMPNEEISRESLWRTQTPHIFSFGKLWWAHEEAKKRNLKNSAASCSLMYALGETFHFSLGSEKNIKITTVDDLDIFRALLKLSDRMGKIKR